MLLQEMEMFYYIVELGNFSKAAEKLQVSKAHVSRSIVKLEKEMNVQLLFRSTRKISLTQAGEKLFQHCTKLLEEAKMGINALSHFSNKPFGTLRITAPSALGNYVLANFLPSFLKRYPDIKPIIELENNIVDIIQASFDLAIRSAILKDSQLVAQRLGKMEAIICASPTYFKKRGLPEKVSDLAKHACCVYTKNSYPQTAWQLSSKEKTESIEVQPVFSSNQTELLKKMALAGVGVTILQPFAIQEELKAGLLVRCLPQYIICQNLIYAIYPQKKFLPKKTQVFIKEFKAFLKKSEAF